MRKMFLVFGLLAGSSIIGGCASYQINSYGASLENVTELRGIKDIKIKVNDFTSYKPGLKRVMCRAAGKISTQNGDTLEKYIKDAFVSELKLADLYSDSADVVIDGYIEKSTFSSAMGSGEWYLTLDVSSNTGTKYTVESTYNFDTAWTADQACQQVAQQFVPAVQKLIKEINREARIQKSYQEVII